MEVARKERAGAVSERWMVREDFCCAPSGFCADAFEKTELRVNAAIGGSTNAIITAGDGGTAGFDDEPGRFAGFRTKTSDSGEYPSLGKI